MRIGSHLAAGRPGSPPPPPPGVPALHVHDVSVRFSDAQVLENVSVDLAAGRFLAIVGPNGGGKSTLMKVALGLVQPQHGHAALFGEDAGVRPDLIGYVPQLKTFDRTFPATAVELVVTGITGRWPWRTGKTLRAMAAAALQSVGAFQLRDRQLSRLSGGELQRTFLARALVRRPQLVLLDEPAAGVDFLAEHDLYDLLEHYQADTGAAVAMITHDLAAARYHADDVLILNRRVHGHGAPGDVLTEERLTTAFGHRHHDHAVAP